MKPNLAQFAWSQAYSAVFSKWALMLAVLMSRARPVWCSE